MSSLFNDTENDLPLHPRGAESMRTAAEMREDGRRAGNDREFTLSTGTVLGMFLVLALLCVGFFGFGYSMGRKSAQTSVASTTVTDADAVPVFGGAQKPAPGSPAAQPIPGYVGAAATSSGVGATKPRPDEDPLANANGDGAAATERSARTTVVTSSLERPAAAATETSTTAVKPVIAAAKPVPAPVVRVTPPATVQPAASTPVLPASAAAAGTALAGAGTFVQIVAVSHQEDANVVMSALRRRGYNVVQRSTNTDPLIHVQIGPFASRKEAEAMKQRLSGDGYNAILK